eukprot:1183049-Prorocentrum_minimum.AAC.1
MSIRMPLERFTAKCRLHFVGRGPWGESETGIFHLFTRTHTSPTLGLSVARKDGIQQVGTHIAPPPTSAFAPPCVEEEGGREKATCKRAGQRGADARRRAEKRRAKGGNDAKRQRTSTAR